MIEKNLPIGTICRLKDGKKSLMIIGFCQTSLDRPDEIYDYSGCLYPEGVFSQDVNFLFNHDQIDEVLFNGFVNQEELDFKRRLNEFMQYGTIDGKKIDIKQQISNAEKNNDVNHAINNENIQTQQQPQTIGMPVFDTLNFNQQNNNQ